MRGSVLRPIFMSWRNKIILSVNGEKSEQETVLKKDSSPDEFLRISLFHVTDFSFYK